VATARISAMKNTQRKGGAKESGERLMIVRRKSPLITQRVAGKTLGGRGIKEEEGAARCMNGKRGES